MVSGFGLLVLLNHLYTSNVLPNTHKVLVVGIRGNSPLWQTYSKPCSKSRSLQQTRQKILSGSGVVFIWKNCVVWKKIIAGVSRKPKTADFFSEIVRNLSHCHFKTSYE